MLFGGLPDTIRDDWIDDDDLWLLACERPIPPAVLEDLLAKARQARFAADALIIPGGEAP
jgi:hypothetical protein